MRPNRVLSAVLAVTVAATFREAILYAQREGTTPPGAAVEYRVEAPVDARALAARFTADQVMVLEALNRSDAPNLSRLPALVVPLTWSADLLAYSPFPLWLPAPGATSKLLIVDQAAQAFAAYEDGRLVRWGPVSTGQKAAPTPNGRFQLNWRSRARNSTVDPTWYMEWYFNFDNMDGLALHAYTLPGYPASHGCIRLLARDAIWLFGWGDASAERTGETPAGGTPVVVWGQYDFDAGPPWRSLEVLARGIQVPQILLSQPVR